MKWKSDINVVNLKKKKCELVIKWIKALMKQSLIHVPIKKEKTKRMLDTCA